ncbi:MAG TPA: hypothetical protein VEU74_12000 [Gemmatimonadales bacterium]|nr:hypothetical protein [Gemmatimonadales bacterium]
MADFGQSWRLGGGFRRGMFRPVSVAAPKLDFGKIRSALSSTAAEAGAGARKAAGAPEGMPREHDFQLKLY